MPLPQLFNHPKASGMYDNRYPTHEKDSLVIHRAKIVNVNWCDPEPGYLNDFTSQDVYDNVGKWADPVFKGLEDPDRVDVQNVFMPILIDEEDVTEKMRKDAKKSNKQIVTFESIQQRITYWLHPETGNPIGSVGCDPLLKMPRNPIGRTGITGRGRLGKWGPNQAADTLLTRWKSGGELEMFVVIREECGSLAMPGGMVELSVEKERDDVAILRTAKREFLEEVSVCLKQHNEGGKGMKYNIPESQKKSIEKMFEVDPSNYVYRGYVDDYRNTDHAWMETTCYHIHIDTNKPEYTFLTDLKKEVKGDDEVKGGKWITIGNNKEFRSLFASHMYIVLEALRKSDDSKMIKVWDANRELTYWEESSVHAEHTAPECRQQ